MTNDNDFIIAIPEEAAPTKRFPVFSQLFVLFGVLSLGFALVFFLTAPNTPTPSLQAAAGDSTSERNFEISSAPEEISLDEVSVTAASAYVWDVVGQRVLYSKQPNDVRPLASITKLMTALVAYELVAEETEVVVPKAAVLQEGSGQLRVGELMSVRKLADLALISSSNDAAYALGAAVGELLGDRDPDAQFVAGMNIRAAELGFSTMSFLNPTGLDVTETQPGAVGTAREVTFLMEYILTHYPDLLSITTTDQTRIYNSDGEYHEAENTNQLVFDIPNLLGSKTGFTDLAGGNLVVAFDAGFNRPIIVTVLGSTRQGRFADVEALVAAVQKNLISPQ